MVSEKKNQNKSGIIVIITRRANANVQNEKTKTKNNHTSTSFYFVHTLKVSEPIVHHTFLEKYLHQTFDTPTPKKEEKSRHTPKIIPTYTIRSTVGFRPYTPHIWQGMRMLPPISDPIPMTDPPPPISAPSPPEDPPGARFKLWGLCVWPYIGLEQANLLEGKQKS